MSTSWVPYVGWAIAAATVAYSIFAKDEPLQYDQYQASNGQAYTAIRHEDGQGAQFDLEMSLGQQARDFANSTADMSIGIQNYMNGLDILVTQFDDGMAKFYQSMADGKMSAEDFADYMSTNFGNQMDVTAQQAAAQVALDGPGGTVTRARIFAASVAPVPLRLPGTEARVTGRPLDKETLAAAAASA